MRKSVAANQGFGEFVGKREAMHHVYEQILTAASSAGNGVGGNRHRQRIDRPHDSLPERPFRRTLHHHNGRRADTTDALSITERHLYRKMKTSGL